jgi:hypothetical protein
VAGRSWLVTYLLLRGPTDTLWFYDVTGSFRAEAAPGRAARAVALREGQRPRAVRRADGGDAAGAYTWHLVLTDVDRYRAVAASRTRFELDAPSISPTRSR